MYFFCEYGFQRNPHTIPNFFFFVAAVVILGFVDLFLDFFVDFCWVMLAFMDFMD